MSILSQESPRSSLVLFSRHGESLAARPRSRKRTGLGPHPEPARVRNDADFSAIHLASALEMEELTGQMPSFYCFDDRLRDAASAEGLAV